MLALRDRSRLGLTSGLLLAALLLAPLLGPGYVLVGDMAFVPRIPLGTQLLGRDGVPRGVPSELLVALLSRVVATGWLQDGVLVLIVVAGAWGAARLAPTRSRPAAVAAATAYGWSAYLHERLLLGQWAVLVGWAVLPWAVRAAVDWRRGGSGWWAVGALAVASLAGANALLLVAIGLVVCGRAVRAIAATAVLSLPWALPGLLQAVTAGDPHGVSAFAARSDAGGVLVSLLTGGGVWSREAVPPGRATGVVLGLLVLVVAAAGAPQLRSRLGSRPIVLAGLGLLLSLLGRLPLLADGLRWAVVHVPAAGLLRDGQRQVVLLTVVVAAAFACGVDVLLDRLAPGGVRQVAAALLVLTPLAALPGGAWGESGRLTVSRYPVVWSEVLPRAHGAVLVLPWTLYRDFPWSPTFLDPATKMLGRPVVNDALPLTGRVVRGEDPVAARLDGPVRSGTALLPVLRAAGVQQVLVERTTRGYDAALAERQTQGLRLVAGGPELALYDVPGRVPAPARAPLVPIVLGDLAALALALVAGVRCLQVRRAVLPDSWH